ncbi:UDP-2,4-diacetamido-2,4,6-trideoxy-beta-L-altropyranose hydrolase [Bacillus oleivorans]|uniref:UDP-2,4-diacetamido-2,4,6-trideoxy-beta-L-altropyranose hydrolase n=1 Tax=Bacillus oleivorans TaxID=1448271 RepID=A0A285D692_9BACI|nr:UDP-2,4-diacetamido-2,4,6-trideoxy-beta-L-altropyranose hydrolase [Bacillus oleivorans]SNX74856.1 UDP-2,4-diacetamido-2,4,6-trideoxy-beta-L-altropyranose hydrolase [Bacillus oleivorans]
MKAVFRVDASVEIGTGHVMRCLTLAERLREKEVEIFFICRELPGNLNHFIESKGFFVHRLKNADDKIEKITNHSHWLGVHWKTDVLETIEVLQSQNMIDWLIIDHYAIDKQWEEKVRPFVKNIMIIDDLADRKHDCKILLDQNFFKNYRNRYDSLVPNHCLKILGPKYALLRSEFLDEKLQRKRDGNIKRIFIFFGGIDLTNETAKTLEAIRLLKREDIKVDVVLGRACPHKEKIKKLCLMIPNTTYFCQVNHIADLMGKADLAIGAGGTTTWERLFLGLPAITLITAKNQADILTALDDAGAVWNLGHGNEVQPKNILQKISHALDNPDLIQKMSEKGKSLMGVDDENRSDLIRKILEDENEFN